MTADPAAVARIVGQAVTQGHPETVTDPETLDRVAFILTGRTAKRPPERGSTSSEGR